MITDQDTNFVFLSNLIREKAELKVFWHTLEKTLRQAGIKHDFIHSTNDLWCRDYMPVQVSKKQFIQFKFDPSYYKTVKYSHLLTDTNKVEVSAVPTTSFAQSSILLDGGNLIRSRNTVILTDRIFKENHKPKEGLVKEISQILRVENIYLIPALPCEVSGHADGMVRLLDDHTLLYANFPDESPSWRAKYKKALEATGMKLMEFPNVCDDTRNEQGEYAALGCYINFAWIGDTILFPQFDMSEDREALKEAKQILKGYKVLPVPAADLAMACGVLNCATWNIQI